MAKRVAVVQSNYIPWKGYFDLIRAVDEFVLFDDVQYTRRDWRNRNLIKTPHGLRWLSIPVATKGRYLDAIKDIETSDPSWPEAHWQALVASYAEAPFFAHYRPILEPLYLETRETRLSAINRRFLDAVCALLGIGTRLTWSMDYRLGEGRTERLVELCRQAGATTYVSGPSARGYLEAERFQAAGIELVFFDYSGYPEYAQLYPPFDHHVSVLDLLFAVGPAARDHLLRS
jgi:WbqC-like protein